MPERLHQQIASFRDFEPSRAARAAALQAGSTNIPILKEAKAEGAKLLLPTSRKHSFHVAGQPGNRDGVQ